MGCGYSIGKDDVKSSSSESKQENGPNINNQREIRSERIHVYRNQRNGQESSHHQMMVLQLEPYLQSKTDPYFNFPEVKGEKYVGKGLKKMKGYISNIPLEELKKKRRDFWETRIEGNKETWDFLRNICENPELENEDIGVYLTATGVVPYEDCINVTYDNFGGLYEIPNYCIHDPLVYDLPESHKNKPEESKISIIIKKEIDCIRIKRTNYLNVSKLKEIIKDKFPKIKEQNYSIDKLRLFFGGKELEDDKELWFYNITDGSIILLMIKMY